MFDFLKKVEWGFIFKILGILFFFTVAYFVVNRILNTLKNIFLKKAKTKKEKSNIEIFFNFINYFLIFLFIIFAFFAYGGNLTGIGVVAGLLSAALGWALQRPITGMAAWLMVILKRPFEIGDRVIIGNIKGDVTDITLTHIHIREIGGTISSEETSGRIILIPNAKLFEENIINYTFHDELILDQVIFTITYESNLEKAKKIALKKAKEVLCKYFKNFSPPYLRIWLQPSGINIHIRYQVPAQKREEISSEITQAIIREILSEKEINFAYPHQEVLIKKIK